MLLYIKFLFDEMDRGLGHEKKKHFVSFCHLYSFFKKTVT